MTISSPGLDLSVQKFDLAAEMASGERSSFALSHGSGSISGNSDSANVPIGALLSVATQPTSIFTSSGNYFPANTNVTSFTGAQKAKIT